MRDKSFWNEWQRNFLGFPLVLTRLHSRVCYISTVPVQTLDLGHMFRKLVFHS